MAPTGAGVPAAARRPWNWPTESATARSSFRSGDSPPISGTVTDEAGEPVIGVELRAFERRYLAGQRRLVPGGTQLTDDRGVYRFGTLQPGDYLVAFVSREVTMPAAAAEILRGPSNAPKFQELLRERFVLGDDTSPAYRRAS